MEAELIVYPLSKDETQIELRGRYTPPLGAIGSALDSQIGHRVADASVHRFVTDVASSPRADAHAAIAPPTTRTRTSRMYPPAAHRIGRTGLARDLGS
jgi:hypothetical protein